MKKHSNQDWKKNTDSKKSNCQVSNFSLEALLNSLFFKLWISPQSCCCFPRYSSQKVWFPFYLKVEGKVQPCVTSRPLPFVTMHGWGALRCPFYFLNFDMHRSFFFCFLHFKFQILHLQYAFFRFCILYFAFYILRFAFASLPHDTFTTPPFDLHDLIQTSIIKRLEIYFSIYQNSSECFR